MSVRGWGGTVGAAAGIAAGAGAAQVGLGYGLGVIVWLPTSGDAGESAWVASLTWAVWIAATSTVAGALGATRLARLARTIGPTPADPDGSDKSDGSDGPGLGAARWPRLGTAAAAAALGGSVSVVLIAIPAREAAGVAGPGAQPAAAGYALAGVALGLLLAIWALASPAVARNLVATVAWLWALAVGTVVASVATGRPPAGARLGGWPDWAAGSASWFRGYVHWPAAALSLGAALLLGALAAWSVARAPRLRVGAAVSGAVGPASVAAAHLVAPAPDGIAPELLSAYLVAPYAVIAGLAGSALAAGFAQRRATRATRVGTAEPAADRTAGPGSGPTGSGPAGSESAGSGPAGSEPTGPGPAGSGSAGPVPDQRGSTERRPR